MTPSRSPVPGNTPGSIRRAKDGSVISRIEGKHRKGCFSVAAVEAGSWDTPWAVPSVENGTALVWLTKSGLPGRRTRGAWIRFGCNDSQCTAKLVVNLWHLLKAVQP